jgi:hypothetical protein
MVGFQPHSVSGSRMWVSFGLSIKEDITCVGHHGEMRRCSVIIYWLLWHGCGVHGGSFHCRNFNCVSLCLFSKLFLHVCCEHGENIIHLLGVVIMFVPSSALAFGRG